MTFATYRPKHAKGQHRNQDQGWDTATLPPPPPSPFWGQTLTNDRTPPVQQDPPDRFAWWGQEPPVMAQPTPAPAQPTTLAQPEVKVTRYTKREAWAMAGLIALGSFVAGMVVLVAVALAVA